MDLTARVVQLEHLMSKAAAVDAICRLKLAYAAACDAGYKPEDMRPLFTDDAVWSNERFGTFNGIDEICDFYGDVSARITWARHFMIGHEVDVADDLETATGQCYLFEPCALDGEIVLLSGTYQDRYRKVGGDWFMEKVHLTLEDVGVIPGTGATVNSTSPD